MTKPTALEQRLSDFVRSELDSLSGQLEAVLNRLVEEELPCEVAHVHFEVFPDGFTSGFPVRAFFLDQNNNEHFVMVDDKARYPTAIDPGLLEIPFVYTRDQELEFSADQDLDVFTVAGNALIEWFKPRWRNAGGSSFQRRATIGLHDDLEPVEL